MSGPPVVRVEVIDPSAEPEGSSASGASWVHLTQAEREALLEEDGSGHRGGATEPVAERPGEDRGSSARKSASTMLVELAHDWYSFGLSDAGEPFALPKGGPPVVVLLRGAKCSLRSELASAYFRSTGKVAPQQALADALLVIEGEAHHQEGDARALHLRVAAHESDLWLDLGDQTGRAVRITSGGWTVDVPPILFKRTALNGVLPDPVSGGSLDELWRRLNVTEADRPLIAAWLVAALHPDMPHPVLHLSGEQGTGKTSAAKMLVQIVDPSPVPVRTPPRDVDSWITAAAGSWVVGIDNLSAVPAWLSDSLCRAVTGDGDVRRRLYTDGDLAVFAFRRCVVTTGIDLGALHGDLTDRLLPVHLDVIADTARLEEQEMWRDWEAAHPRILGAVLDLAASVKAAFPSVALKKRPRMADFARVLAAVDAVLGTSGLDRYLDLQGAVAADSLTGDPFIVAVRERLTEGSGTFEGTAADLLALVTPSEERWRAPKGWPSSPRVVTQRLHQQAPVMRKAGWTIDNDGGNNKTHATRWALTTPTEIPRISSSPSSPSSPEADKASQASQASHEYGPSQDGPCSQCGRTARRYVPHHATGEPWCPACCHETTSTGP